MANSPTNSPSGRPGMGLRNMAKTALLGFLTATNVGCSEPPKQEEKCKDYASGIEKAMANVHSQLEDSKIFDWKFPGGEPDTDDALVSLMEVDALYKKLVEDQCLPQAEQVTLAHKLQEAHKAYNATDPTLKP